MERFSCSVRKVDGKVVVAAHGDVDLAVSDDLVGAVRPHLGSGHVVLDCARITFLDSWGVRALVLLRREADALGSTFALSAVPARVQRVLDLSGTASGFLVEHGVPED